MGSWNFKKHYSGFSQLRICRHPPPSEVDHMTPSNLGPHNAQRMLVSRYRKSRHSCVQFVYNLSWFIYTRSKFHQVNRAYFAQQIYTLLWYIYFYFCYTLVVRCRRASGIKTIWCFWIAISRDYTTLPYLTIRHVQTVGNGW